MTPNERYLDLLSIFHYVVGGMAALFACFPLIHLAVGIAWVSGAFDAKDGPPRALGWIFIVFAAVFILSGWTLAGCIIAAGRKLRARRSRTFCMVMAGIESVFMPFGTVLGVLTLIVLTQEETVALFGRPKAVEAGAP